MTKHRQLFVLLIFVTALLVIGGVIGVVTNAGKTGWYDDLIKSPLTPPGWVFGVVWPILYIMIATSAWMLWRMGVTASSGLGRLFIGQLCLNWGWSFVFFTAHWVILAFFWIVILGGLVGLLIYRAYPLSKGAAWLLVPYLGWLMFASYLAGFIALFNPPLTLLP
jgi:translocator protein